MFTYAFLVKSDSVLGPPHCDVFAAERQDNFNGGMTLGMIKILD
jgi:hypothetical protein